MRAHAEDIKVIRLSSSVAAGQGDVVGSGVDFGTDDGFDGVIFVAELGVIAATSVTTMKAQQDTDVAFGTAADILGSLVTAADTDDEKFLVLDIYRPEKQFVRPVVGRATADSEVDSIIAILYDARKKPTIDDATVAASKILLSPAEGTP